MSKPKQQDTLNVETARHTNVICQTQKQQDTLNVICQTQKQ